MHRRLAQEAEEAKAKAGGGGLWGYLAGTSLALYVAIVLHSLNACKFLV